MAKRVLFVCLGNICRSPTGEAVLRHRAGARGLGDGDLEVDSAGTLGYHAGSPPDRRMARAAARRGYQLDGAARRVVPSDYDRFDLIVAMDEANRTDLRTFARSERDWRRVRLLTSFLPAGSPRDVPDPYHGDEADFERVLDLVEQASEAILDELFPPPATAP